MRRFRWSWSVWVALGVSFGRPAAAVVSLVLVCLVRVRCWFRSFRGCGGIVRFGFWVAFSVGSGRCAEAGAKNRVAIKEGPGLSMSRRAL